MVTKAEFHLKAAYSCLNHSHKAFIPHIKAEWIDLALRNYSIVSDEMNKNVL